MYMYRYVHEYIYIYIHTYMHAHADRAQVGLEEGRCYLSHFVSSAPFWFSLVVGVFLVV